MLAEIGYGLNLHYRSLRGYKPKALRRPYITEGPNYDDSTATPVSGTGHLHFLAMKLDTLPFTTMQIFKHSWNEGAFSEYTTELRYNHLTGNIDAQFVKDSATSQIFAGSVSVVADTWYFVLISVDPTNNRIRVYINGQEAINSTNSIIDKANKEITNWEINRIMPTFNFIYALWNDDVGLDITQQTNRDLFHKDGKIVDLGPDGSTPFGQAAKLYFINSVTANQGTLSGVQFPGTLTVVGGPNA